KDTTVECSDPRLTRSWELGRQALFACAEDNYLDCPWRERGVYVGDALVSWDVDSAVHGDPALLRWTIDLFLDGQGDAGLIRPGAHVLNPGRHPDYSTILLQAAKRYIEVTGDKSVLTNRPDQWRLLVEALLKLKVDSGLYDGEPLFPYIDISQHRNREPLACAFNCFIYKAMADGAWLFEQIGDSAWAKTCQEAADDLRPRIIEHYWDDQQGVFTDLPRETGEKDTSVHSNTLALLYGVADEAHTKHAWQWLREAAKDNFFGEPGPPARDAERVNAYFSYYLLDLMRHMGEYDLAVWYIGRCWGYMLDHGAWTTWESFGGDPGGSLCHVWGASPTWLLTRSVLGVDLDAATRGENVALEPHDAGLEWARGVVPHAKGRLEVSWRKTDAGFEVEATAPEGVEVALAPGVEGTLKR
ncbi:MAG: MGH1-like glycoside hydrolase domain-containing protein, partial [Phycisphaeraceae bacterium]